MYSLRVHHNMYASTFQSRNRRLSLVSVPQITRLNQGGTNTINSYSQSLDSMKKILIHSNLSSTTYCNESVKAHANQNVSK